MSSLLSPILQRLAGHFPIPTMARAVLERCLNPAQLDAGFETVAEGQYTRTLLFSTLFELMMQVVSRQQPSIHAAYQAAQEPIAVSVKAVYNKLNGLEPGTSAALVRYSAEQAEELIAAVGGVRPGLLAGYRVKILDGNWLAGREHRLAETRGQTAAPLPGKALLVFDPALEAITDCVPSTDAYTQERALLPTVLERVRPGELWIADRNFCTRGLLWGLRERGAVGLVREHEQIRFKPLEATRVIGDLDSGRVSEQRVLIDHPDGSGTLEVRRLRLQLNVPTRDGDDTLYLLTTVPAEAADACALACLYRERWTLEKAFLHLTIQLRCEINTLAYPPAALFGLAMAVVAYNSLAVVKATLRQVHGAAAIDDGVSGYYLVNEMARVAESLETLVEPRDWAVFQTLTLATMAAWLLATAEYVQLRKYRKHPRGPKMPPVKRTHDPHRPHVSVARLLALRQQAN
ncbi:MAG: transposase [Candidatus Competibacter sp.]